DRNVGYYNVQANRATFATEVLRRARAVPGVASATVATNVPFDGSQTQANLPYAIPGRDEGGTQPFAVGEVVGAGYFETLGVPLLSGRTFDTHDVGQQPTVAIVSRALAAKAWPGQSPVGAKISVGRQRSELTVVGVVGDVRTLGLDVAP